MKFLSFGVLVSVLLSCSNGKTDQVSLVKYEGGEQLLTLNSLTTKGGEINEPSIRKISPDSVVAGEELLVKIFIQEPSMKLVDAFFDCQRVPTPAVDTTTFNVRGCRKKLFIRNDTITIGFRPTETGLQSFPVITILTRDKEKIFRTYDYTFKYNVVKK
jgi:hypothetical protein